MHELLYYSIFAIVLYFVLTQVFENFNIEQENFDPSLVPVSSIVTLAKVAQKLVNGNGTLTNPGNLQIGASASAPGNLTVTGSILNGGLTIKGGSASPDSTLLQFGDGSGWRARIGKAGSPTLDVYDNAGGGVHVTGNLTATGNATMGNLYSQQDTTVNRNLQVNGNINANGTSSFGGQGEFGFQWGNENNNGWSCLRTNRGNKENRLCFNRDHGLAHFYPGGHLDIQGKITVPRLETDTINATGKITANTLQVDGNVTVNNELTLKTHRWHKSTDGKQRLHFSNNGATHYGSGDGHHYFRTGANADSPDGVIIDPSSNLIVSGYLYAGGGTGGAQVRVGELWGFPGIYTPDSNKAFRIYSEKKEVMIGHPDNLNKLILYGHISYHGMTPSGLPVGSFKIRAHGIRVPLYYGWNQTWWDHGWSERMRNIVKWNGSTDERFVNYVGTDCRANNDNNWYARYYSLMPGYKLQFYCAWSAVGPEYTGEQIFGDNAFESRTIHMIAVRLISETWALPNPIWY